MPVGRVGHYIQGEEDNRQRPSCGQNHESQNPDKMKNIVIFNE